MKRRVWHLLAALLMLAALALALFLFVSVRGYEVQFVPEAFSQSSRRLDNPDRGFYRIRGYIIQSEPQQFGKEQEEQTDDGQVLELVQINLKKFRTGEISDVGLQNVEQLFRFLEEGQKRYIIRFLYDWTGDAYAAEPESIDVILNHMRQLSPILKAHSGCIFVIQGLFVGNWGEMNGTDFGDRESVTQLAAGLAAATAEETFLSVRTPAYWRQITGGEQFDASNPLAARLGLYNDGILGNASDFGTYSQTEQAQSDPFAAWGRSDELAFQEALCRQVPNGGEVVVSNPLNDFDSALQTLRTMHITYLNCDYDKEVLEKWADAVVEEPPFEGMDGLSYVDRHLGYRYWIESAFCRYSFLENRFHIGANLKNTGFAPLYSDNELMLTLVGREERIHIRLDADLSELAGGNQRDDVLAVQADIPLKILDETEYQVYLEVCAASQRLELANDQEPGEFGIHLGQFRFRHPSWYQKD